MVFFFFFLLPVPLFEYCIHTNALMEQQRNSVAIEFVERNQKCDRRQVFSQKIFFAILLTFMSLLFDHHCRRKRIYCCNDDSIINYCFPAASHVASLLPLKYRLLSVDGRLTSARVPSGNSNQQTKYE